MHMYVKSIYKPFFKSNVQNQTIHKMIFSKTTNNMKKYFTAKLKPTDLQPLTQMMQTVNGLGKIMHLYMFNTFYTELCSMQEQLGHNLLFTIHKGIQMEHKYSKGVMHVCM